jgi:hypothetical protein
VALSKRLKELSYGSRFTFVANWHSDSNHPSDLATRRSARLGVTKTVGSCYRLRSAHWVKVKNPAAPVVKREAEEDRSR